MKLLLALTLSLLLVGLVHAQQNVVPQLITYQGKLVDAGGAALPDRTYSLAFKLYDAPTAGTLVWGQTYTAPVTEGVFSVALGSNPSGAIPGAGVTDIRFAFGAPDRFLQVEVLSDENGDARPEPLVLLPRQQMGSVPYAVQAQSALHGVPAGTILPYGGTTAPPGFLMCAGQSVSRTQYATLFEAISTSFGAADGETFRLPDLRGRFLRGADDPDGPGASFGSANRDPNSTSRTAMNAGGAVGNNVGSVQGWSTRAPNTAFTVSTSTAGNHEHSFTAANSGFRRGTDGFALMH